MRVTVERFEGTNDWAIESFHISSGHKRLIFDIAHDVDTVNFWATRFAWKIAWCSPEDAPPGVDNIMTKEEFLQWVHKEKSSLCLIRDLYLDTTLVPTLRLEPLNPDYARWVGYIYTDLREYCRHVHNMEYDPLSPIGEKIIRELIPILSDELMQYNMWLCGNVYCCAITLETTLSEDKKEVEYIDSLGSLCCPESINYFMDEYLTKALKYAFTLTDQECAEVLNEIRQLSTIRLTQDSTVVQ
ncbi:MAG TPA: hypothetical protein PLI23_11215 [Thermoclostridium caenicola]|uniref:hypothetical protein n=1 Tax=Thermoclostridium caenicola TaxID=659425 RepID=UPI002BF925F8|nr:hypothetical protein [Thermoclostridium caenicola]HPO77723.1 hypothetical protein [Thermoclostridium caenicola]